MTTISTIEASSGATSAALPRSGQDHPRHQTVPEALYRPTTVSAFSAVPDPRAGLRLISR
jgi:hypothetical protein